MARQAFTQDDLQRVCRMLTDKYKVNVVLGGSQCMTDGDTIHIPTLPAITKPEVLAVIRSFLDHEAGHIVGKTDFKYFEAFGIEHGPAAQQVLNALEDIRCEAIMARLWAGVGDNLSIGSREVLSMLDKAVDGGAQLNPLKQLTTEAYAVGRKLGKPRFVGDEVRKVVAKFEPLLTSMPDWAGGTEDLGGLAVDIVQAYAQATTPPPPPPQQQPQPQQPQPGQDEQDDAEDNQEDDAAAGSEGQAEAGEDGSEGTGGSPAGGDPSDGDAAGGGGEAGKDDDAADVDEQGGDEDEEGGEGGGAAGDEAADEEESDSEDGGGEAGKEDAEPAEGDDDGGQDDGEAVDDEAGVEGEAGGDGGEVEEGDEAAEDEGEGDGGGDGEGGGDEDDSDNDDAGGQDVSGTGDPAGNGNQPGQDAGQQSITQGGVAGAGGTLGGCAAAMSDLNAMAGEVTDAAKDMGQLVMADIAASDKSDPAGSYRVSDPRLDRLEYMKHDSAFNLILDRINDFIAPPIIEHKRTSKGYRTVKTPNPQGWHSPADVDAAVRKAGGAMRQRLLQILKSEDKCMWRGGLLRGSPDPANLAQLALRTSDRVMRKQKLDEAPDTACALLMDLSGSMYGRQCIDASVAAMAFASVMDGAGHPCLVAGFRDDGRNANFTRTVHTSGLERTQGITLYIAKNWGEKYRQAIPKMARLGVMASGGTPMAESIVVMGRELARRQERRKVLMVFTDGEPGFYGNYQKMQQDGVKDNFKDVNGRSTGIGEAVTINAIKTCEAAGIEVVLIGLNAPVVHHLHKKAVVVGNIHTMAKDVMVQLQKALHH